MNVADLRKALTIQDSRVQISAETLHDRPFTEQLLTPFYGGSPIVIEATPGTNTPTIKDDGANKLEIQGATTLPALHLEHVKIHAIFEIEAHSDRLIVTLHYTLRDADPRPNKWIFSQSFPDLPLVYDPGREDKDQRPVLDDLQLGESYFVLTTASHQDEELGITLQPGLNFVGQWLPKEMLGLFGSMLGDNKPLTLFGPIVMPIATVVEPPLPPGKLPWDPDAAQPPGIHLQASLGIAPGFGKLTLNETRFQVYCATSFDWQLANLDYAPVMAVTGSINIPNAGAQRFTALKQLGLDTLLLEGEFSGVSLDSLTKLGDLAGGDLTEGIPKDIGDKLKNLELQSVALSLVPQESGYTVEYINLAIGMPDTKWTVFESVLAIDRITAGLVVYNPFDSSRRLSGYLAGRADIAGVEVDVKIGVPNFYIYAALGAAQSLPLQSFFDRYLPSGVPTPTDLTINRATILAAPGSSYGFALGMAEAPPWNIDLGSKQLMIRNVELAVSNRSGQANTSKTSGSFSGVITFANVDLSIAAAVTTGPDGGWQFEGSSGRGQEIKIGELIRDIVEQFDASGEVPKSIEHLIIQNLHVSFKSQKGGQGNSQRVAFAFACEARFPVEGREIDILITVDLAPADSGYTMTFGGTIIVGILRFELRFSKDPTSTAFAATYSHTGDQRLKVGALVGEVLDLDRELRDLLDALEIDLKDLLFVYQTVQASDPTTKRSTFLFGLDIGASIGLSSLPLVGKQFPPGQSAGVDNLRLLVASGNLTQAQVTAINNLLPSGVAKIAAQAPAPAQGQPTAGAGVTPTTDGPPALTRGLTVSAVLNFGGTPQTLTMPVAPSGSASGANPPGTAARIPATPASPVGVTSSDSAKWFTLQKSFGPLQLQRVGVQYKDAVLWFLLDAALSAAGLTLSLDGLGLGSPITKFDPRFSLRGLGIDYRNEAIEIGGAFLRAPVKDLQGRTVDQYAGAAVVKAKALTLSAIGAYAYLDGQPSLFVYAVLDYPIGGPSFFFVTGLAGGFGYNRALIVPPIEGVAQFPLVKLATKDSSPEAAQPGAGPTTRSLAASDPTPDGQVAAPNPAQRVMDILTTLSAYVPPSTGDFFLAVGIKFTSFKIIDSFVLLTIAFGHRFELNVLGLATLVMPPSLPGETPITPLAEVQMALKASFIPDQGLLSVSAQLTAASFILSRACHLTGGFAFYCWFAGQHAGDFALTLGGYHPAYKPPAHYPRVPRLGINWQVDNRLAIKGELYFALTPSALMAGGQMQATWDSGDLKAWFQIGADFIISWKPYFYDAHAYASLRVSYTFQLFGTQHLSFDASADLHLWGPEFSGTAHIKLSIIEFDIAFGAATQPAIKPISWPQFKASFLPHQGDKNGADIPNAQIQCCGVAVKDGLLRKIGESPSDLGIVNAKQLVLVTNTVIPSSGAYIHGELAVASLYYDRDQPVPFKGSGPIVQARTERTQPIGAVGVAPMALRGITSTHMISITWSASGGDHAIAVEERFTYTPVLKSLPAALWGGSLSPNLNGSQFVERGLSGFEIRPAQDSEPGESVSAGADWQYDTTKVERAYSWEAAQPPAAPRDDASKQRIKSAIAELIGGEQ